MDSFKITNELIDDALCGIKETFVNEMILANKLDKTRLKRFAAVALPVAAAAAVVTIALVGKVRIPATGASELLRHIDRQ